MSVEFIEMVVAERRQIVVGKKLKSELLLRKLITILGIPETRNLMECIAGQIKIAKGMRFFVVILINYLLYSTYPNIGSVRLVFWPLQASLIISGEAISFGGIMPI